MRLLAFSIAAWVTVSTVGGLLAAKWIAAGHRRRVRWPDGTITDGGDAHDLPGMSRSRGDAQVGPVLPLPRRGGAL